MQTNAQVALTLAVESWSGDFHKQAWEKIQVNAEAFLRWLDEHDAD